MPAVLVLAAEAVLLAIQGHTFSLPFEAERSYANWDLKLEDAAGLRVDVVPVFNPNSEMDSRGSLKYELAVDVGVRKRLGLDAQAESGQIDVEEIDRLVFLVEELHEFFLGRRLNDESNAIWTAVDIRAAYIPRHLKELRQFTGLIRLSFESSGRVSSDQFH